MSSMEEILGEETAAPTEKPASCSLFTDGGECWNVSVDMATAANRIETALKAEMPFVAFPLGSNRTILIAPRTVTAIV